MRDKKRDKMSDKSSEKKDHYVPDIVSIASPIAFGSHLLQISQGLPRVYKWYGPL